MKRSIFLPSILLALGCSIAVPLSAQDALPVAEGGGAHRWGPLLDVLEDPAGLMDYPAAASPERAGDYRPVGAVTLSRGYSSSAYWVRGRIFNAENRPRPVYVVVKEPSMQRIDCWENGSFHRGGSLAPMAGRDLAAQTTVFRLDLAAGEERTVYFRLESRTSINASFLAFVDRDFFSWKQAMDSLTFAGLGALAFSTLFSAGIAFGLRSRAYAAYAVFVGAMLVNRAAGMGYLQYLFLPDSGQAVYLIMILSISAFSAAMLLFNISFLQTRDRFPFLHRIHLAGLVFAGADALLCAASPSWSDRSALFLMQPISILSVIGGVASLRRGQVSARYYLLAWAVLFVQAITFPLGVFNLRTFDLYGDEVALLSTALMAVLMSLALSDSVSSMRREKDAAQAREQRFYLTSVTDELTGLYNRRYLNLTLEQLVADAVRDGTPLSLLMLDVDRFKVFNDTWGHPAGDRVLASLGEILKSGLREQDIPCRYGGEEFVAILRGADEDIARATAERIRERFAAVLVEPVPGTIVRVTVSIGAARLGPGDCAGSLLIRSDKALYAAKEGGRNRVALL